jgi:hypothetical protein
MANFSNTRSIVAFQQLLGATGIEVVPNKNLNEDGTQGYHVRFMKGTETLSRTLLAKSLGKTLTADLQVSDYETVDKKTGEVIKSKMIHKAGEQAPAVATFDFSGVATMAVNG